MKKIERVKKKKVGPVFCLLPLNAVMSDVAGLGSSKNLPVCLMDYESTCPPSPGHLHHGSSQRDHMTALEEQLLSYSENTENEGEDEYLEERMLQVRGREHLCYSHTNSLKTPV